MIMSLFHRPKPSGFRDRITPRRPPQALRLRPRVESMEERTLLSTAALTAPVDVPALVGKAAKQQISSSLPLKITGISVQNGQLVATGTLAGHAFTTTLDLTAQPNAADPTCPILNLMLGPIHLDLLGLKVDTSKICLKVTAQSGPGNLLGNLLCDVANLLNGGTLLGDILGGLTSAQTASLTDGLTSLLNGALSQLNVTGASTSPNAASPSCPILNLSLAPVDLTVLGLNVHLDNCNNGPITVAITAQPGSGNLLGNLLCGVSHLLDSNASATALSNKLDKILGTIGQLV